MPASNPLIPSSINKNNVVYKTLRNAYHAPQNWVRGIYRRLSKNSIFFDKQELGMCSLFPVQQLDYVLRTFAPKSVLDIGCGTGISLDYFLAHDIDVQGLEGSALAIQEAKHPERIRQVDLNKVVSLGRVFDLVWCFEVAEHIHPQYVDMLMTTLSSHGAIVVLSAAHPGQGGEGHFNEQPPEYWIAKFVERGFKLDKVNTEALRAIEDVWSTNMLVFTK